MLAYCKEIATFFVDLFHGGLGDWDPKQKKQVNNTAIGFAVVAFYLLDFTLNALQASLRNLLLDVTPPAQLNSGNAWHGRMTHAGNIVGYGFGFLPLATLPVLRLLGGSQFRKFCVVAMTILIITVAITCVSQDERVRKEDFKDRKQSRFVDVLRNIRDAVINLPRPIRRVCFVQIFAFMGWWVHPCKCSIYAPLTFTVRFPFLFYAHVAVVRIYLLFLTEIFTQNHICRPSHGTGNGQGARRGTSHSHGKPCFTLVQFRYEDYSSICPSFG